jgi:hypothetical protein
LNWKQIVAGTVALLLVAAAIWVYLVASYESGLGTSNTVLVSDSNSSTNNSNDNKLLELSFDTGAEDLLWASLGIELEIEGAMHTCSFGVQSNPDQSGELISTNLGADGLTFTTVVNATDDEKFTFLDIGEQIEGNESNYWMKFSSTDIFLADGVKWLFLGDVDFKEVIEIPSNNLSNNTEDSLDWYTYDLSVHRIDPNDGVYVVEKNDMWFKINFLSYYNSDDESRFPAMQIAALNVSVFPALNNSDLVVPSPCIILTEDSDIDYWNANETIILAENGINLCGQSCDINVKIKFETTPVDVSRTELV